MARRPAEIVLSAEERTVLEPRAAFPAPACGGERAKLVLYAADGLSNVEIAARLHSASDAIGRWRSRFARERMRGLEDRYHPSAAG